MAGCFDMLLWGKYAKTCFAQFRLDLRFQLIAR